MDIISYKLGQKSGGGGSAVLINKDISANGTYNASSDNVDGYKKVNVNVQPNLESKSITISTNTTTTITPTTGKDGLSSVEVITNVPQGITPTGNINITDMNSTDVTNYATAQVVDADLVAENIKKDVNILGVTGTYEGSGGGADLGDYFVLNPASNENKIAYLIKRIPENLNTSNITNAADMFRNLPNLIEIPLIDTSNVTNMQSMFDSSSSLISVPLLNTTNVTNMSNMFFSCNRLETIPLLVTSNVTTMNAMFRNCRNLTSVPLLNTEKVTTMNNMFAGCTSLTNTSLDNILQMCINATSYTGTKTLAQLGFNSTNYPSATIQALPHYQDFINAGWTIGW